MTEKSKFWACYRLICLHVLALGLAVSSFAYGDSVVNIVAQNTPPSLTLPLANRSIGNQLAYFEDADGQMGISDILLSLSPHMPPLAWRYSQENTPNFGYSKSAFWFRFSLSNELVETADLLLAIEYPLLDELDVFILQGGKVVRQYLTGDTRQFNARPIEHRNFLFPFNLPQDERYDVYVRAKSEGALQLPISVWDRNEFLLEDQQELALKSLYYGMMLVMVLYNLFLFIAIRERAYLYYVGFVSCFALMQASMHGVLFQFFYPALPALHQLSVLFFVPATMLFGSLFAISFLNLRETAPLMNSLFRGVICIAALCTLGAFFLSYRMSTQASVFMVIGASVLMLASGPVAWSRGLVAARYYTIAWFALLLGTTSTALNKFGLIASNGFTEYGLIYGSALEAVLLSFALADRLNVEREARYRAQRSQLKETEQRMQVEEQLLYHSTHESSTGLPNKVPLFEVIDRLNDENVDFALVKVLLGRFGEIDKTLGHNYAEQIQIAFAKRLCLEVSALDGLVPVTEHGEVAHYDSMSFIFLLELREQRDLDNTICRLRSALSVPIEFRGMRIDTGVLIGATKCPDHSRIASDLIKQANIAIGFSDEVSNIYDPALNPYSEKRLSLMGDLREAIEQNQLSLHFQPQLNMKTGEIIGAEALVRWNHPVYGFIPPMEFIPDAEQTGVIKPLTHWVFDHALFACRQLINEGEDMDISINISAANLHETDIVKNIQVLLNKHGVPAERLKIEITETAMMINPEHALEVLTQLHKIGVKIAVDDFGTGHSSLSYIKQLPADEIKIDRSFVAEMNQNSDDEVIVSTTINMCHNLGYSVVAEGIEDELTQNMLRQLNCDVAQGYYHSRPLPFEEFKDWVRLRDGDSAA